MNSTIHERPGVYSSYDASTTILGGGAKKGIGLVAKAAGGEKNKCVYLTNYAAGATEFGADGAGEQMQKMLRLLYQNGAASVVAVAVGGNGEKEDYEAAFALLEQEDIQVVLCDSGDLAVQQALRTSVEQASQARRERIAVIGSTGEDVNELVTRAKAMNSERVVLVAGEGVSDAGTSLNGMAMAAAMAGAIATNTDPAVPLNGAELSGLVSLTEMYSDDEIDLLVRGGVTPLECVSGVVSVVRGITTHTTTGGAADSTWREISTILIVDDVIPQIRNSLRRKFARSKNTAQTRSAIRSQVIVELENKRAGEIIDSYGDVTVTASAEDAGVCEVAFSFTVVHGLNQIYLTAHITV